MKHNTILAIIVIAMAIFVFCLCSCTATKITATPVRIQVENGKVFITPQGKPILVKDTVIYGTLLKRN